MKYLWEKESQLNSPSVVMALELGTIKAAGGNFSIFFPLSPKHLADNSDKWLGYAIFQR